MEFDDEENGYLNSLTNNYQSNYDPVKKKRPLLPNLDKYDIPPEVKEGARKICFQLRKEKNMNIRSKKTVDFYCLFMYYSKIEEKSKDPKEIAKMINLNESDINKAFSVFTKTSLVVHHPEEFINSIVTELNYYCEDINELITKIKNFSRLIIERDEEILDEYPQTVARAIVYYYFEKKNLYKKDKKKFFLALGKSIQTLDKIKMRISQIVDENDIKI